MMTVLDKPQSSLSSRIQQYQSFISESSRLLKPSSTTHIRLDWMVFATLMGVLGAVVALTYSLLIEHGLYLLWTSFPEMIHRTNLFDPVHCSWIIPTTVMVLWGLLANLSGADLANLNMNKWIDGIIEDGKVSPKLFGLPVYLLSSLNIVGGSSIGPEAPLVFIGAALGSKVATCFNEDPASARCLTLSGAAATLAIFFGFPIASAFFALEMPHPTGYEYFELLPPVIWASIVSSYTGRILTGTSMKCDPAKTGFTCFSYKVPSSIQNIRIPSAVMYGVVAAVLSIFIIFIIKQTKTATEKCKGRLGISSQTCMVIGGLFIGCVGMLVPQTLFWGELQLQVSLNAPLNTYPVPWISHHILKGSAIPLENLETTHYLIIALAKLIVVSTCIAVGMCGGVVFPVMVVASGISRVLFPQNDLAVLSIMGATLASICRVPIASLILLVMSMRLQISDSSGSNSIEVLGALVTNLAISVFVANWISSCYPYFNTRNRT